MLDETVEEAVSEDESGPSDQSAPLQDLSGLMARVVDLEKPPAFVSIETPHGELSVRLSEVETIEFMASRKQLTVVTKGGQRMDLDAPSVSRRAYDAIRDALSETAPMVHVPLRSDGETDEPASVRPGAADHAVPQPGYASSTGSGRQQGPAVEPVPGPLGRGPAGGVPLRPTVRKQARPLAR